MVVCCVSLENCLSNSHANTHQFCLWEQSLKCYDEDTTARWKRIRMRKSDENQFVCFSFPCSLATRWNVCSACGRCHSSKNVFIFNQRNFVVTAANDCRSMAVHTGLCHAAHVLLHYRLIGEIMGQPNDYRLKRTH